MNNSIEYRNATTDDLDVVKVLLENVKLPVSDIDNKIDFIVAVSEGEQVVGCIGVEKYGSQGLLRSFAVNPDYRDQKIGKQLLDQLVAFSNEAGIETLHLLTTTAEKYFAKQGFSLSDRDQAPPSIKATTEFSFLCPSSSIYMYKNIASF